VPDFKPGHGTWTNFCREDELTRDEYKEWRAMAGVFLVDDAAFRYVRNVTSPLFEAAKKAEIARAQGGWSDLVNWADANHRLKRAEIAAYRKYQASLIDEPEQMRMAI